MCHSLLRPCCFGTFKSRFQFFPEQSTVGGSSKYVFPDGPPSRAFNYCRNPTKDPTGAWCYVDELETDLCDVPRCSGIDSNVLLMSGGGVTGSPVHWMYVLPEWRNGGMKVELKRWIPGTYEAVSLHFRRSDDPLSTYDLLQVGAERDEKIKLFRADRNGQTELVTELVYPHLMAASRWKELRFDLDHDEPNPSMVVMSSAADGEIFRWTSANNGRIMFIGLSGIEDGHVGIRFPSEGIP